MGGMGRVREKVKKETSLHSDSARGETRERARGTNQQTSRHISNLEMDSLLLCTESQSYLNLYLVQLQEFEE